MARYDSSRLWEKKCKRKIILKTKFIDLLIYRICQTDLQHAIARYRILSIFESGGKPNRR